MYFVSSAERQRGRCTGGCAGGREVAALVAALVAKRSLHALVAAAKLPSKICNPKPKNCIGCLRTRLDRWVNNVHQAYAAPVALERVHDM